ncbi:MAG: DUF1579 domain-containing protein [Bacteroidetes bacterium]|nr:DUF1579 domain-containing protein [Bacteroidota bacterium]
MKKLILLCSLLVILTSSVSTLKAQDQETMKRWMEYMTPGEQHTAMAKSVGDWKYTSKMWMDPAQPPTTMDGTAKFETVYGGRYLQAKITGTMMGMPFEGTSLTGYNNATKKYFNTWIDNMGTGVMVTEGTSDASGLITLTGSMFDPTTGKNCTMRETWKMDNANKMTMEMYSTPEGGTEKKDMEIVYTR